MPRAPHPKWHEPMRTSYVSTDAGTSSVNASLKPAAIGRVSQPDYKNRVLALIERSSAQRINLPSQQTVN